MFEFFKRAPQEESPEDDQLQPGELPEAIIQDHKGDWVNKTEADAQEDRQTKETIEDEASFDAVGGFATEEEWKREEEMEKNYNAPKDIQGETQYDKLIAEAGGEDEIREWNRKEEVRYQDQRKKLEEQTPLHPNEEVEGQFDGLLDREANRKRMQRMHEDFDSHARGGNSKPLEKDVKGSEKIGTILADNDNTIETSENEVAA